MSILANIIKGVGKRFTKEKQQGRFAPLSRYQKIILKHQEDTAVKTTLLNGQTIRYKRPYELLHTYNELFAQEIYHFKCNNDAPVILDCGANIGLSVLYFKAIYPNAILTAFEPDPDNFKLLQQNIQINNLKNITPVQAAVWKEKATLEFAGFGGQGSRIDDGSFEDLKTTPVEAIRLADVLQQQAVDFLKIDIEGAECEVIKDCASYLSSVRNMFLEYHGKAEETSKLSHIMNILSQSGFKTYIKMAADPLKAPFVQQHTQGSFDVQLNIFCYR